MDLPLPDHGDATVAAVRALTRRLSAAWSAEAIGDVVSVEGCLAAGAATAELALLSPGASELRVAAPPGRARDPAHGPPAIRLDAAHPWVEAVRASHPVFLVRSSGVAAAEGRGPLADGPATALAVLPVWVGDAVAGVLSFTFAAAPPFARSQQVLLELLAAQVGEAVRRTELADAERRARAEAQGAARVRDEFLATLSHELRTPLNAILGWAQMLAQTDLDPETRRRAIETIARNANAQNRLICDVLDVSRAITGRLRLNLEDVEIFPLLQQAIETVLPAATARGVSVEIACDADQARVTGDADRLQQVAWNLLSNAVKFTPSGGWVRVRVSRGAGELTISVADNGRGIEAEFLPRVFDRFSQADSSASRERGGLGLGLAIVRHLVELHGGSIEAASDGPGRGSVFTVRLPVGEGVAPAARPAGWPADVKGGEAVADLRGTRIVVADAEASTRGAVAEILRRSGAQVFTAGSVSEALARVGDTLPHVLVADMGLSSEGGQDLMRRVRSLPLHSGGGVPALALVECANDRARSILLGYQGQVPKPVVPDQLLGLVAQLRIRPQGN